LDTRERDTDPRQAEAVDPRIIGALELCCRRGEMLLIQNKRVHWQTCQIGIPGATAKDKENRRMPFNPKGRIAAILRRRKALGPEAYVFGSENGAYQPNIQTAWETLRLLAHGVQPRTGRQAAGWNREQLQRIDLRWHDLRHDGACRLLADGVDIRIIQLMLGHASIQQTQRYLNVTDEELRRGLEVSWNNKGRPLRLASGS
jgi:integrase